MGLAVALSFIHLFVSVFNAILLARVIWSWFEPMPSGGIDGLLFDLTEPILAPIRKILPGSSMALDFSPLVAFLLLQLLGQLASSV